MLVVPNYSIAQDLWIEKNKLSGKQLAQQINSHVAADIEHQAKKPGLAVLLVGDNPASEIYVKNKEKTAIKAGFNSILERVDKTIDQQAVLGIIDKWNKDPGIHGILVQLPLPGHLNADEIIQSIHPDKDADGFHVLNAGKLALKQQGTIPCTPLGVMCMLNLLPEPIAGKNALVLGRSSIVGQPMSQLLLHANCTVHIAHSRSQNINKLVSQSDIIVAAMGKRGVVDCNVIPEGAIVIDVGMHRVDGQLKGDLEQDLLQQRCSYYTPVPGGVGPMTIAMLMYNTLQNKKRLEL